MKRYKILYYPAIYEDFENIADYISVTLCAPQAARNLLVKFQNAIENLETFPFSGTELAEIGLPLKYRYRWLQVESYMIFYTVDEQAETVNVMRALFASSDYLSIL